ncbi:hypothetical protein CDL12_09209 [Handroanthus impetiginosus]|uniref:Pectinesterase inhibitor domain-containing protein n=1 Tax=Handroanthus impetiginosus TaxID=429701 RepID=A0A2G9HL16_9LAMI|nr:hypothetical protein CDL12_09209 [Handroanthus impetiginosus]
MGFPWFILLLFILFISLNTIPSAHGNSDLIQKTCKNTKYYDLYISSLKSDFSTLKADTKGLALIIIRVGISNATATNSYLSSQMLSITNDTLMKKVMTEFQDLNADFYDYACMHVMAAQDYPNGCHNAFRRYQGLVYPVEIAVGEDGLKHICDVVLEIIDALVLG